MGIGQKVFDAQWGGLVEARAVIRVGRKQIDRCLCGSFATMRQDSEQGTYEAVTSSVKVKRADWPIHGKQEGTVVDFARAGSSEFTRCRVAGVSETDGILTIILESQFT